jgi:hypothetical protein
MHLAIELTNVVQGELELNAEQDHSRTNTEIEAALQQNLYGFIEAMSFAMRDKEINEARPMSHLRGTPL